MRSRFHPEVLLFDEPLSNLDAKLRVSMRVELRELQKELGITALYVTHDQEEALAISDRVIVMNAGRIEQIGTPEDIYRNPRTLFVADFVGNANVIRGQVQGAAAGGEVDFATMGGPVLRAVAGQATGQGGRGGVAGGLCRYLRTRADGRAERHAGHDPSAHVPRRLHSIRGGLAVRTASGAPPADRPVRGGQRGDGFLRARALRGAVTR